MQASQQASSKSSRDALNPIVQRMTANLEDQKMASTETTKRLEQATKLLEQAKSMHQQEMDVGKKATDCLQEIKAQIAAM